VGPVGRWVVRLGPAAALLVASGCAAGPGQRAPAPVAAARPDPLPSAPAPTVAPAPAAEPSSPVPATVGADAWATWLVGQLPLPSGTRQVVLVTASAYGQTTATLEAFQAVPDGWRLALGPFTAEIGRAGFAPPGAKREGDGRTPSGTFGFEYAFGVAPDPGTLLPYRAVAGPWVVWDDDPSSPNYNLWVDERSVDPGADPEPMYVQPDYDWGAVIAYNAARTPGLGSAIFLHVSDGSPTSGCVALPSAQLLAVLRFLDPSQSPVVVMGVNNG
jgi:L,D-peptidoglycan transpeptidase YkuD (ErfK/YbiS/YcfS/YnhG family)